MTFNRKERIGYWATKLKGLDEVNAQFAREWHMTYKVPSYQDYFLLQQLLQSYRSYSKLLYDDVTYEIPAPPKKFWQFWKK